MGNRVKVVTDQVKVRVTGDAELLAVLREAFADAMEEFGLEVIEKGLPRAYGGHSAVFLTALKVEIDDAQSPCAIPPYLPGKHGDTPPFGKGGKQRQEEY